ncbi:MAG: recombination protein O N-terminal domain-containing protein [Prevotella sp.]|nr:recombination protein O N-terminal domain-containing protein [Prevotella sp.]
MLVKTEAIVLHSFKYGESKLIVDMFTREAGRLSFVVPLPKTPKSRLKKQYFQPMTLLEVECDLRQQVPPTKPHPHPPPPRPGAPTPPPRGPRGKRR